MKQTEELMDCLGVLGVEEVVSSERLRWYRHEERTEKSDWVIVGIGLQGITAI